MSVLCVAIYWIYSRISLIETIWERVSLKYRILKM